MGNGNITQILEDPGGLPQDELWRMHFHSKCRVTVLGSSRWGQAAKFPRILTVRAQRAGPGNLELTCSTIGGSVAATLEWPDDAPVTGLAEAILAAVKSSGFTGLKEPLWVWNLRLLKPDGVELAGDALLLEQFGLLEPPHHQG